MPWFKKWWQEKYGNHSNRESYRGGNKCIKSSSSDNKPRITLRRETICEIGNKNVTASSSESLSSSTSHTSVQSNNNQSNRKSIQSSPIACRLRQQAKDLESIISGSVSSNRSINVENESYCRSAELDPELLDPDDFFENPDDIRPYKEKNAFIDEYIIVDIKEVEAITQANLSTTTKYTTTSVKYQTTEFVIKSTKVKTQPPRYSMTSYCNDGYGLFYGTPSFSLSQFPETFCYRTFDEDALYGCNYTGRTKGRYKSAAHEKPTSSRKLSSLSETLEEKVDAFEKSLMGPLINELPKPCAQSKDKFSIQKTFGLTDDGDIIVNVDHIMEEKGSGFLFARKISIYRSVEQGDAICEKRRIRKSILAILKEFFYQLCKFMF